MKRNEYHFGNATVYVYRPNLTDAERKKREGVILTALQQYGRAMVEAGCNADNEKEQS